MSELSPLRTAIQSLARQEAIGIEALATSFEAMLAGSAEPEHIAAFLMGLSMRGETAQDMLAGAKILRQHARTISLPYPVLDTCGTGGLSWTSLNTSSACAIVVAAAGGKVAKHGNRSVPPKTGSADVLEALGVNINVTEAQFKACIDTVGVGFMFAPSHHAAMRHVGPVRKKLGIRTIFNLLGPLSNPANADFQILGVNEERWLMPMAEALKALGVKRAWVVHGLDGVDELSVSGWSAVADIAEGQIRPFELSPKELDITEYPLDALAGGDAAFNASAIRAVFEGAHTAFREAVRLNAGAGLHIMGLAQTLPEGIAMASKAIESGAARATLDKLIQTSHQKV